MRSGQHSVLVGLGDYAANLVVARLGVFGRGGCSSISTDKAMRKFLLLPCLCVAGVEQAARANSQ